MKEDAMNTERIKELEESIASISDKLKAPGISQLERLLMHEDRKDMRKELAQQKAMLETPKGRE
jgi:hypothetical protein